MKRRNFLKSASAFSAPFLIGGVPIGLAKPLGFNAFLNGDSDRILVLIQLNGGNDGLNTLMQLSNYDVLANLRPNILIPETDLLKISDDHAFHPSMSGIRDLYDDGMVQIIQNVAYPNQNRSHFRSTDIWTTGSESDEFLDTGWLGRYMATEFIGYPDGYPNDDCPDPLAITLGNFVSETCQGETANFSIAVRDLDEIRNLDDPNSTALPDNCYGDEMRFLIESIRTSNAYSDRLAQAADLGNNLSDKYVDGDSLAEQLMTTARLISGGLQTKVYLVSIGGFDTHANQVVDGDPAQGTHAELWSSVSDGICAFFDDLKQQGLDERVTCMTFSEFGRQIRSNGSLGTDHGTAAPLFVFGKCVEGGITGDDIPIPADIDQQTGVPMQYDFRDVYGTILDKWFTAGPDRVKSILFDDYQPLNIFINGNEGCFVNTDDHHEVQTEFSVWPNPTSDTLNITLKSSDDAIHNIDIFNNLGALLYRVNKSYKSYSINVSNYPSGQYFARIRTEKGYAVKSFVKY